MHTVITMTFVDELVPDCAQYCVFCARVYITDFIRRHWAMSVKWERELLCSGCVVCFIFGCLVCCESFPAVSVHTACVQVRFVQILCVDGRWGGRGGMLKTLSCFSNLSVVFSMALQLRVFCLSFVWNFCCLLLLCIAIKPDLLLQK